MTSQQVNLNHYDIIVRPVLTEKSNRLVENQCYMFDVAITATKPEIKAAFEAIFGAKVKSVNTLVRKGKQRVFRGRRGMQKDFKRAMVTLMPDQRVEIVPGV